MSYEICIVKNKFEIGGYRFESKYSFDSYDGGGAWWNWLKDEELVFWRDADNHQLTYGLSYNDIYNDIMQMSDLPKAILDEISKCDNDINDRFRYAPVVESFMRWLRDTSLMQIETLPVTEFTFVVIPEDGLDEEGNASIDDGDHITAFDAPFSEELKNDILSKCRNNYDVRMMFTLDAGSKEVIKYQI